MEVILLERIERLGQMGDVVKVKPGYARNYLLPQKKALRATEENRAHFEAQRTQLEALNLERRTDSEAIAAKLEGLSVVLIRQAGESGQLYGSVTTRDLTAAIAESARVKVERRQIQLDRPIKSLGLYTVRVALHPEVVVGVIINVAKSEEEAEAQAKAALEAPEAGEGEAAPEKKAEKKKREAEAPGEAAEAPAEAGAPSEEAAEKAAEPAEGQASEAEGEGTPGVETEKGAD